MFGLPAIADDMDGLARGADPSGTTLDRLHNRLGMIEGRGACAHPDGATRFAAAALRVFAGDVADLLDEWGYAHLASRDVPPSLRAQARAAASACPTLALRLHRLEGENRPS